LDTDDFTPTPEPNIVADDYGVVGGGSGNIAGSRGDGDPSGAVNATVGGGFRNTASNSTATVGGGFRKHG
jgi:hypothetical protein